MLGVYGDSVAKSPRIDELAARGTLFTKAYCQWPICGPSRASVLTSLRPEAVGVLNLFKSDIRETAPGVLTLPEHFKNHGYTTTGAGKIFDKRSVDSQHDGLSWTEPFQFNAEREASRLSGLEVSELVLQSMQDEMLSQGNTFSTKHFGGNASVVLRPETTQDFDLVDGQIATYGLFKMRELASAWRRSGVPFFLAIGLKKPHLPFWAPKRFWDLYAGESLPSVDSAPGIENETGFEVHGSEETRGYFPVPVAGLIPTWLKRDMLHGYLACVSWVDHLIGRIVDEADSLGITNHTATVLWSDHGFHLGGEGDHGMWGKRSPLENSLRVPLIFVPPGGSGSAVKRVDAPVELLDIFPTLCEMSGLPIPSRVQGRTLVPLMAGTASASGDEGAISMIDKFRRCLGTCPRAYEGERAWGYSYRTSRYSLTRWVSPGYESARRLQGSVDLFDLEADPGQTKNLATSSNALVPRGRSCSRSEARPS